jgi:hypothetical protein
MTPTDAEHSDAILVIEDAIGQPEEEEENIDLILSGPDLDSIYYHGAEYSGEDDETVEEIHS